MQINKQKSIRQLLNKSQKRTDTNIHNNPNESKKNHTVRFADFAKPDFKHTESKRNINVYDLKYTPVVPNTVYQTLPPLLKEACAKFQEPRDRDVFLTSALTILSGSLPNISGLYYDRTVYPNLYAFIIAPPASNKGDVPKAKELGMCIHRNLLESSRLKKDSYEVELKLFKKGKGKSTSEAYTNLPIAPKRKLLFMPGNTSSTAVIKQLSDANGRCIICETEADTMGNTLKQDWGGYSDLLRKSFHHETVSYSRKTDNEFEEVENPRLSVLLTGTPSQVTGLIPSVDDGLFSRFIFYAFSLPPVWRDVSPKPGENKEAYFRGLSQKVAEMAAFLEQHPKDFQLTDNQWQYLNTFFDKMLSQVSHSVSEDISGTVKRLGLITFRIAMILTAIRNVESEDPSTVIVCDKNDFNTAVQLVEVYLSHATYMFDTLPKKNKEHLDPNKKRFFDALPQHRTFERKEAVSIAANIKIKERTADKYLKNLCDDNLLIKDIQFGSYQKV